MRFRFLNALKTTLGAAITTTGQASLTLAAGVGATMRTALVNDSAYAGSGAALPAGDGLVLAVIDNTTGAVEQILLVGPWDNTGTADVLGGAGGGTLTRGYDNSTAATFALGATVVAPDSRMVLNAFPQSGAPSAGGQSAIQVVNPSVLPTATDAFAAYFLRSLGSHPKVARPALMLPGQTDAWMPQDSELTHRHARYQIRGTGFDMFGLTVLANPGPQGGTNNQGPALAPTSRRGLILSHRSVSSATAGNAAGFTPYNPNGGNSAGWAGVRNTAAGQGAWWARWSFGFSSIAGVTPIAGSRIFAGLSSQFNTATATRPAITGTDPSQNAADLVGLCADQTLTNFSLVTRDNSAGGTAATTYAFTGGVTRSKTVGILDKLYDLLLVNGPGDGVNPGALYARVLEWDGSGALWVPTSLFDGVLAGALMPRTNIFLMPTFVHDNASTATAVGFDLPVTPFMASAV